MQGAAAQVLVVTGEVGILITRFPYELGLLRPMDAKAKVTIRSQLAPRMFSRPTPRGAGTSVMLQGESENHIFPAEQRVSGEGGQLQGAFLGTHSIREGAGRRAGLSR